jgi:hypothetical protein
VLDLGIVAEDGGIEECWEHDRGAGVDRPPACPAAVRRVARAAHLDRTRAVTSEHTVISFLVKVPVLSEQMTETAPRVSTAGRRRMIASSPPCAARRSRA